LYYDKIIAGQKMNGLENKTWRTKIYGLRLGIGEIKIKHYPRSRWGILAFLCVLFGMYHGFIGYWREGIAYPILGLIIYIISEISRLNKIKDMHYKINSIINGERGSLSDINECISVLVRCQKKQFSEELNILINYLRKKRDDRVE